MQVPLQITVRDMPHSDALDAIKRQVEAPIRVKRGFVKAHATPRQGESK